MASRKKFPKLVIAIASSALFDLSESDKVFREQGALAYRKFQKRHIDKTLKPGAAFPFITRLLKLNRAFKEDAPDGVIDVVLLSRNSHETGLRVFRSIQQYKLDIQKAGFFSGESPYKYIEAFGASLFLSANYRDVKLAIAEGYPAGMVVGHDLHSLLGDKSKELRIAFDFDGILADHESEKVYRQGSLKKYQRSEARKSLQPLNPGPLQDFAKKIVELRKLESLKLEKDRHYQRVIKIALITARSAPPTSGRSIP